MKKYIFIFLCLLLWGHCANAKENVFCQNDDSLTTFCMGAADVMYKGFVEGYTDTMEKYQKNENSNQGTFFKGIKELIPYDIFQYAFKYCGETQKNMQLAQKCLLKELQKYILDKSKADL